MTTDEWCRKSVVCEETPGGLWEVRVRFLFDRDGTEAMGGSLAVGNALTAEQGGVLRDAVLKWLTNYTSLAVSAARAGTLTNPPFFTPEEAARIKERAAARSEAAKAMKPHGE